MSGDKKNEIARALRSLKGADVLATLAKIAPLPNEGVVGGQAVASVVMTSLGLGWKAPINDVDVFLPALGERGQAIEQAKRQDRRMQLASTARRVGKVGLAIGDGYSQMGRSVAKLGYSVLSTQREGMLNEVVYDPVVDGLADESLGVLRGFDLNCVQAGVDLRTGELLWTPEFESFAASGQLKVVNVNTPYHTAARYLRKKAELGCFGDDELNMAMCALPWARGAFEELHAGVSSTQYLAGRYGQKVHEQCEALGVEMSRWFREVKAMEHAKIWTMEPVFEGREETLSRLVQAARKDSAQGVWRGSVDVLMFSQAERFCSGVLRPEAASARDRARLAGETMRKAGARVLAAGWVEGLAQARGKDYLRDGDLSAEAAKALSDLVEAHGALAVELSHLTLARQGALACQLRQEEREYGSRVYGWLESQHRVARQGQPSLEELLLDKELRGKFFLEKSQEGDRDLAAPLDLPQMGALAARAAKSLLKIEFKELTTKNQLEAEGREMRHCVGGYSRAVESGESRIFKVEGEGKQNRSTLELGFEGHSVELRQLRSFANAAPGIRAQSAAEMLASSVGKDRPEQLLAVASALAGALDEGEVPAAKLRSAMLLTRLALKEALSRDGLAAKKLSEKLASCMRRHFPQELAAGPAEDVASAPKSRLRRLLGRG